MVANGLDLLTMSHLYLFVIGVFLYMPSIIFLKIWMKKKKFIFLGLFSISFAGALLFSLIIRIYFIPGGSMHHTKYLSDRIIVQELQKSLEKFRIECGRYPNTTEGLQALVVMPDSVKCLNTGPFIKKFPTKTKLNYSSNSSEYVISAQSKYSIHNLIIHGSSRIKARLYIKDTH